MSNTATSNKNCSGEKDKSTEERKLTSIFTESAEKTQLIKSAKPKARLQNTSEDNSYPYASDEKTKNSKDTSNLVKTEDGNKGNVSRLML